MATLPNFGGYFIIKTNGSGPILIGPGYGDGANGRGGLSQLGTFSAGSWQRRLGSQYENFYFVRGGTVGSNVVALASQGRAINTTQPWTMATSTTPTPNFFLDPTAPFSQLGTDMVTFSWDDGNFYKTTNGLTWTSVGAPTDPVGFNNPVFGGAYFLNDGTNLVLLFTATNTTPGPFLGTSSLFSSKYTGTGWTTPVLLGFALTSAFNATVTGGPGFYAVWIEGSQRLYVSNDAATTWELASPDLIVNTLCSGLTFYNGKFYVYDSFQNIVFSADYDAGYFSTSGNYAFESAALVQEYATDDPLWVPPSLRSALTVVNNTVVLLGTASTPSFSGSMPAYYLNGTLYKPNGATPENSLIAAFDQTTQMLYAGGQYYIFTSDGSSNILTSSSLTSSWTPAMSTSVTGVDLFGAASNGGTTIVAVGNSGVILQSTDAGITWTRRTSGLTESLRDVVYNGTAFVAVGNQGTTRSTTGTTWTATVIDEFGQVGKSIATDGTNHVIVNDNSWYYSTNGTTWTQVTTNVQWNKVRYLNGAFYAVGRYNEFENPTEGPIGRSVNGSTITAINIANPAPGLYLDVEEIVYGNNIFVAVGSSTLNPGVTHTILYSTNGTTWTAVTTGLQTGSYMDNLVFGNGRFVATGAGASNEIVVYTSTDGINWTTATIPTNRPAQTLEWNGTNFLIGVSSNSNSNALNTDIYQSADGTNWSAATTGIQGSIENIKAVASATIATGPFGLILKQ